MPTLKLTDAAVQKFKAPAGQRIEYFDATLPGFGLRVAGPTKRTPSGRKSWVLFYRVRGEQKRLTLGFYVENLHALDADNLPDAVDGPGAPLSLADARRKAGDALQLVARGVDPASQRAEARAEAERKRDTVGSTVELFLSAGMKGKKGKPLAPRYVAETRRNFENHVLPRWKDRDLKAITRRDVVALLDAIAAGEEASPKPAAKKGPAERTVGGPIAANRVLAAVRAMLNWALRRGMIEANPCALVEQPGEETRRERTLVAEETRELWPLFVAAGVPFGALFRVLLLTGQRRSECAGMRWDDLDLVAKTWTIPASATKAGRTHVVPLSPAVVKILSALPRKSITMPDKSVRPSPWVFTSDGQAPVSGFSKAKAMIDAKVAKERTAAGLDAAPGWTLHDLRRTAATEMGRLGTPEFVISKVLNHASRGITGQVYNRYEYLAEKKHALEQWGAYVERLVSGGANVVALRA